MNPVILYELNRIERQVSNHFVLRIDHLQIHQGDLLCILGPTGSGKTTFLRMLTGIERPQGGTMTFNGKPWPGIKQDLPSLRRIALVPQRPFFIRGSVLHNVQYGLQIRGIRSGKEIARNILAQLELTSLADQSAQTLSGGQVQLVGLARALVLEPDVLLLDEPTANLDPSRVALVEETIQNYQSQQSRTVIWSTHNPFQARRVASHVGLILDGNWIESASTQSFFEAPTHAQTAQFIQGRMVY